MEEKIIYNNHVKATGKIVLGIAIIIGGMFVGSFIFFGAFFVGASMIFFGLKSTSKKPQLIFSDKGLFIGFKAEKWIKKEHIESIIIKPMKVDNRTIDHIEITMRFNNINSPSNRAVRVFPIENLKIDQIELRNIINEFMKKAGSNVSVS